MSWKWFGVKTVYRTEATGRLQPTDTSFSDDATLVEERVLLFRARSFDEAIAKEETEAKKYAKGTYKNVYGQTLQARYLMACGAFELFGEPAAGVEVFSTTEIISKRIDDKGVVDQYLGGEETSEKNAHSRKFYNGEFAWSEGK